MKFDVLNRWSGSVQFTAEIERAENAPVSVKLGLAVKWAMKTGANLTGANLTGANLTDANLTDANLARANLTDANLTDANLARANLTDANLARANLTGANLTDANLARANLTDAALRSIRVDFFDILLRAIPEIPDLLAALRAGRINGTAYQGDCACLAGTIANSRNVHYQTLDFVDASRPAERWFLGIKKGDTPASNPISKITEAWILGFLGLLGLDETGAPIEMLESRNPPIPTGS